MKNLIKEIELTPKQLHKLRMESPDNNMSNCWYVLRELKMDFTKANELLKKIK